ncbi:MAG: DUF1700 domain-containing protein, partial [Bacteroidota bacterium]
MGSRLDETMERIRAGLADLPEGAARRVLEHYREYIAEALEAGRGEEDILRRLGNPEEIIAQARAEVSLNKAGQYPGPVLLTGAAGRVLGRIGSMTGKASLILSASIPYTLAICLYVLAGAAFAGAAGAAALMAYGISEMAPAHVMEKIGAAGAGVFGAAALSAAGLGLWLAARGVTRLTLRILRRGLGRGGDRERSLTEGALLTRGIRRAFAACAAALLLGVGLIVPSGLPLRYFSIWNSMKPSFTVRAGAYRAADIREIEVETLNSAILLRAAAKPAREIRVSYEEPDWMAGVATVKGGKLIFREESRGRLPFLDFIARHEGMTAVTIEVPPGYRARPVTLSSKGGRIDAALPAGNIRIKTLTGNVRFKASGGHFAIR